MYMSSDPVETGSYEFRVPAISGVPIGSKYRAVLHACRRKNCHPERSRGIFKLKVSPRWSKRHICFYEVQCLRTRSEIMGSVLQRRMSILR